MTILHYDGEVWNGLAGSDQYFLSPEGKTIFYDPAGTDVLSGEDCIMMSGFNLF